MDKEPLFKGGQGRNEMDVELSAVVLAVCVIGGVIIIAISAVIEALS